MGWTTTNNRGLSRKQFLDREFTQINPEKTMWEIVISTMVGSVYYAVCQKTPVNGPAVWFGMVVLTNSGDGAKSHYNIGYKEMDESMSPVESDAPIRMIDFLDKMAPVDPNSYAGKWRARCRANAAAKKQGARLKTGVLVKFEKPFTFNFGGGKPYGTFDTFRVVKNGSKTRFLPQIFCDPGFRDGLPCRITNFQTYQYEVVG